MPPSKFAKHREKSVIGEILENKKPDLGSAKDNFKVSFQYLDTTQKWGSAFHDWQKAGLLAPTMEVLRGYCHRPLLEQLDSKKFKKYGDFPPKDKTFFIYPKNVPLDACWGRIHVSGVAVLAGHILNDTFYVVFLDKTHKFWLTDRVTSN